MRKDGFVKASGRKEQSGLLSSSLYFFGASLSLSIDAPSSCTIISFLDIDTPSLSANAPFSSIGVLSSSIFLFA